MSPKVLPISHSFPTQFISFQFLFLPLHPLSHSRSYSWPQRSSSASSDLSFRVASPVWLELPVLEFVLTPGGTPTSRSQAASSRSLACIAGTWHINALAQINLIAPKLNPLDPGDIHDNLSLTPTRKNNNCEAQANDGKIRFDPSITCKRDLAECFRIFTNPSKISTLPARRTYTIGVNHRHQGVTVYTDGACNNNGKMDTRCGSSIWIAPNHDKNTALRILGPHQSNQIGELAAIIVAINSFPRFWPLTIISDSKYAIDGLMMHLHTWEDKGWIGIKNADLFKRAAYLL